MDRWMLAICASGLTVSAILPGIGDPQPLANDPPINLQALTPGTPQVGHGSITGQFRTGGLSAITGGSTAQAVYGYATATSGVNYGGFFLNRSVSGRGVYGYATATSGPNYGGFFSTNSTTGRGVFGIAGAASGTGVGVYGKSISPTGFAGFFEGNIHSTGAFSGVGSGLTGLVAGNLVGTVPDARLGANVARLDAEQVFSALPTFSGGLRIPVGAATGKVLTSDASGLVSWNNDSVSLPYTGTGASSNALFNVQNTSDSGFFVQAIRGEISAPTGNAIRGNNTATTGGGSGVYGLSQSSGGAGVIGRNTSNYGIIGEGKTGVNGSGSQVGVYARANYNPTALTYGLYAFNDGPNGVAALGLAGNNSRQGVGVKGQSVSPSGINYGGWFESMSPESRGLYAYVSSPTGFAYGAFGVADSNNGRGVYGYASNTSGTTYGVYGRHISASGYGVYANGRTGASGTKSFRIDHPFDPENRYLLHYASEGPEPQNFYNGVVRTDAQGEAWIQLPDYFGEINKDFRYTLTVVDDTDSPNFAQAKIAREIRENQFKIRTSVGNVKVSWEVKAIRNDRWVRRYGAPVEEAKHGLERGTYQHPELYGLPLKDDREAPRPDKIPSPPTKR